MILLQTELITYTCFIRLVLQSLVIDKHENLSLVSGPNNNNNSKPIGELARALPSFKRPL